MSEVTRIELELPDVEALALAQFVKRLTWGGMRECAVDEAETRQIRAAIERLQAALREAGWAPR
ncbi:MAG TPA: hypothetical protein VG873_18365 [Burkholderiales bacterium]|nr:hypothetical protein [Burkholderiales bacterium]